MMVRTKIFVKEDTKMLYTEKEKHEIGPRSKHGLRPIPVQFLWKRVGLLRLVTIIKLWSLPKRIRHLAL